MDTFREWKMLEEMWDNDSAEWKMWIVFMNLDPKFWLDRRVSL